MCVLPERLSNQERQDILASVRSSMALSGLEIDQETAERLFDEAMQEPLCFPDAHELEPS